MAHVFGPIPSRRLGRSLGIDPVSSKACNFDCIYCQLGHTPRLQRARARYAPVERILNEAKTALSAQAPNAVDYVTVVGQGEPLLHLNLGGLLAGLKKLTSLPIALITNGALLAHEEVRAEAGHADLVIPSLDAGDQEVFRRINRPLPGLRIEAIIEGLAAFRAAFSGQLWLEIMLVSGVNDSAISVDHIAAAALRIRPDELHINLPVRPPADKDVHSPSPAVVDEILAKLARIIPDTRIVRPDARRVALRHRGPLTEFILEAVRRHPLSGSELREMGASHPAGKAGLRGALDALERQHLVRRRPHGGEDYWELYPKHHEASDLTTSRDTASRLGGVNQE